MLINLIDKSCDTSLKALPSSRDRTKTTSSPFMEDWNGGIAKVVIT